MNRSDSTIELTWANTPVPAARALENFSMAEVGDGEYVFLDNERLEYHTLNASAFQVWQLCNGVRTSTEIAGALTQIAHPLPIEAVELAIADLGGAGLLESTAESWTARIDRRQVVKLAAGGVLGAAVIPAVSSITAPTAAHGETCNSCLPGESCCPAGSPVLANRCGRILNAACSDHAQCCSNRCLNNGGQPNGSRFCWPPL